MKNPETVFACKPIVDLFAKAADELAICRRTLGDIRNATRHTARPALKLIEEALTQHDRELDAFRRRWQP